MRIRKLMTLLLIACSVIPLVLLFLLNMGGIDSLAKVQTKETLTTSAMMQTTSVENFLELQCNSLTSIANLPGVAQMLQSQEKEELSGVKLDELVEMLSIKATSTYSVDRISIVDTQGIVRASSDKEMIGRETLYNMEMVQNKKDGVYFSGILSTSAYKNGQKHIVILQPVYSSDVHLGYVLHIVNIKQFEKMANSMSGFNSGYMLLVDADGGLIASSKNIKITDDELTNLVSHGKTKATQQKIETKHQQQGIFEYAVDGAPQLIYAADISQTGWTVFCGVSVAQLHAPINRLLWVSGIFFTVILFLVLILSRLAAGYLTKPIATLSESIHKIAKGDTSIRCSYHEKNEFGEMVTTFNGLIDTMVLNTRRLIRGEEKYRMVTELSDEIIFEWDFLTNTIDCSAHWKDKFGYDFPKENALEALIQFKMVHEDDRDMVNTWAQSVFEGDKDTMIKCRLFCRLDGTYRWVKIRTTLSFDEDGRPERAIGVMIDIDKEQRELEKLTRQSQTDELTGLYNKNTSQTLIEDCFESSYEKRIHAMMIFDIDDFKHINDNFGHLSGDAVLKQIGTSVQHLFRSGDIAGRIGGDEFIVLMTDLSSMKIIEKKAEEIIDAFHRCCVDAAASPVVSCSMGIAVYPKDGTTYKELFAKADKALYKAKHQGKNQYYIYDEELHHSNFSYGNPIE